MLHLYLAFITHRLLSGVRNGCIYASVERDSLKWAVLAAAGMSALLFLTASRLWFAPDWAIIPQWISTAAVCGCLMVSLASTWLAFGILGDGNKYIRDIHLWTWLEQTALAGMYLFGFGSWHILLVLAFSVYPSVVLQKMLINGLSGLPVLYEGTDDPTGATWGLPSLGIKIRRSGFKIRILLAVLSLAAFFLTSCKTAKPPVQMDWSAVTQAAPYYGPTEYGYEPRVDKAFAVTR